MKLIMFLLIAICFVLSGCVEKQKGSINDATQTESKALGKESRIALLPKDVLAAAVCSLLERQGHTDSLWYKQNCLHINTIEVCRGGITGALDKFQQCVRNTKYPNPLEGDCIFRIESCR